MKQFVWILTIDEPKNKSDTEDKENKPFTARYENAYLEA